MKKKFTATMLKYFLSYFFIFCVSALCFYGIFRSNLIRTLTHQYETEITQRIDDTVLQLTEDVMSLHVMNDNVIKNADVVLAKYASPGQYDPTVGQELKKYVSAQSAVTAAVYIDRRNGILYSSGGLYYISYTDGIVILRGKDAVFVFDPLAYCNTNADSLYCLESNGSFCLIYAPVNFPYYNYMAFYILNPNGLTDECADIVTESVTACAIISSQGQCVVGVNGKALPDCSDRVPGVHHIDGGSTLFISEPFSGGFRVAALSTTASLKAGINAALRRTIPIMFLIMLGGILLAVTLTYITYSPIQKLASEVTDAAIDEKEPIKRLNIAMHSQYEKNTDLEEKINHYRTFIQKSLLDSIISASGTPTATFEELDPLFSPDTDRSLLIIAVKGASVQDIPFGSNTPIVLSKTDDVTVCLLNHINSSPDDDFEHSLYLSLSTSQALIGISSTAASALDISSLYEQAMDALSCANAENSVVRWTNDSALSSSSHADNYSYPYALLEQFSKSIKACDIKEARHSIDSLFSLFAAVDSQDIGLPEFYIRSALIDVLSEFTLTMNDMSIKFSRYDDLFFETLYLCRSGAMSDLAAIRSHFLRLLDFFADQVEMVYINAGSIKAIVDENISNPDFSITSLYGRYDISVAYMSYLFKKETGENFSDYLWKARFEKACELLKEGRHSIDEISIQVGYLHTSSFRRKFKQETGVSPTDYRP